jgi:hypothetical protein
MVSQLVGKRFPLKTGWAVLPAQVTFRQGIASNYFNVKEAKSYITFVSIVGL